MSFGTPDAAGFVDAADLHRWEDDGGPAAREFEVGRIVTSSGLNCKGAMLAKPVYVVLAHHQIAETNWEMADLSALLHEWYGRFNTRFRLKLPVVPLRLDPTIRRNCAGYFRPGYNEFGLVYEIAIRVPLPDQLCDIGIGDTLGTLLHEQLHLLQELTGLAGRNNYHNAQYRATSERFGLIVDYRGHQTYDADSPFLDLLAEFGIAPPHSAAGVGGGATEATPAQSALRQPGRSKLAKWSCGCTNVRVGVADFHARCTRPDCGRVFVPS